MKYIVTSDIHLGHSKTPTKHIIHSFKNTILTHSNSDIDILFISGDLFDKLLDLNSKEVQYIIEFFNYLLNYCLQHDILLRVLEGTPGHDWQQSNLLVKLNDIRQHKCNLKYFKALDIEHIDRVDKYVLYIPDEWTNTHSELEAQIKQKLNEHNITNVDIAILHGQFKYQLVGKKYSGFHFEEQYFLNLVKGYIHVGHYHIYSFLDRIIANGSLERLAHGEESDKGYVRVHDNSYTFMPNEFSYTYKTLNITPSITIEKLDRLIYKYDKGSYIRLLMSREHPFNISFNEIKAKHLDYNLKKLIKEDYAEETSVAYILLDNHLDLSDRYVLEANIYDKLIETVYSKYTLSDIEKKKFLNFISCFNGVTANENT